jgi:hypothetical protein
MQPQYGVAPELRAGVYGPRIDTEPAVAGNRHPILKGFDETDILPFGGWLGGLQAAAGAEVLATFIPSFPIYPPETSWMSESRTVSGTLVVQRQGFDGTARGRLEAEVTVKPGDASRCSDLTPLGEISLRSGFLRATSREHGHRAFPQPVARRRTFDEVDVLVVGGGPAGIGASLGAARKGANTLLVENHSFTVFSVLTVCSLTAHAAATASLEPS